MTLLAKHYKYDGAATLRLNDVQRGALSEVQQKVDTGVYRFENVVCAVCGQKQFEQLAAKDRYGLWLSVVVCTVCGLVQTNPRMTQAAYTEFYNHEYRRLYLGTWDWSIQLRKIPIIHSFTKFENGFDLMVSEDGVDWRLVTKDGFNDGFNYGVRNFAPSPFGLFVGAANPFNGLEIWQSFEQPEP